mmetsp:Transcript_88355/g.230262  ORF Transcript_88355/g.230262 Transcript_88355/m.230262 type:complete len:206 (-) Transcript_88355:138-755(-)
MTAARTSFRSRTPRCWTGCSPRAAASRTAARGPRSCPRPRGRSRTWTTGCRSCCGSCRRQWATAPRRRRCPTRIRAAPSLRRRPSGAAPRRCSSWRTRRRWAPPPRRPSERPPRSSRARRGLTLGRCWTSTRPATSRTRPWRWAGRAGGSTRRSSSSARTACRTSASARCSLTTRSGAGPPPRARRLCCWRATRWSRSSWRWRGG